MPDLQSELAKVNAAIKDLKFDDEEEDQPAVTENSPVVEQVFYYVKAHPGCSLTEINTGLRISAASSRLKSLTDRGILRRTESKDGSFRYYAVSEEYKAMTYEERVAMMRQAREAKTKARAEGEASSVSAKIAKKRAKQREYNRRHQAKLKAAAMGTTHQPAAPQPTPHAAPMRIVNPIDELLDTLSVKQARELYDRLKQMFGG